MKPLSMEYSWEDNCYDQLGHIFLFSDSFNNYDQPPLEFLDILFKNLSNQVKSNNNIELVFEKENIYFSISACAINILQQISDEITYAFLLEDMHRLLVKKQRDYGPLNIMEFSNIGLIVRMFDKVARLKNLMQKSSNIKNSIFVNAVDDESIVDTLMDLIGYSTIGLMLNDEDPIYHCKFLYPMKKESPQLKSEHLEKEWEAKILSLDSKRSLLA